MQTYTPDFQQAQFSPETENLYCPTSQTGRADACMQEKSLQDDTTLNETLQAFKDAYAQKHAELLSLADVVAAESQLVKKSVIVTGFAAGAAAVFACFCWLIFNGALAITLHHSGVHYLINCGILLAINAVMAIVAFAVAKDAYKHISLMPAFHALRGQVPDGSESGRSSS
ncbi:hypothetical protein [Alteromonas sp. H39]|uniref:hypothetical protein n=1 Tax=Alteromonas sp. H39 TaxID=3389876 RepID=UPI0039DF2CBE